MAARRPSLVFRMAVAQALILAISWGVLLVAGIHMLSGHRSGQFDLNLELYAESLADACEYEPSPARLQQTLQRIQVLFDEAYYVLPEGSGKDYVSVWQVTDPQGKVLYRSREAPADPISRAREGFGEGAWGGKTWRISSALSKSGAWQVHVAESYQGRRGVLMGGIVKLFWSVFLVMLPVSLLLSWVASRTGLRPLLGLAEEVGARKAEELHPLHFQTRLAELAPLRHAINTLMARVSRLFDAQQRFLSDAAHELRTPIAGAEVQLHALRQARSPEERQEHMDSIQAALQRAGFLIRQLLVLTRLDSGEGQTLPQTLDLAELCREQLSQAYPSAVRRQVELAMEGEGAFPLEGEVESLRSLVGNLLENAIRHGRAGGHVVLRLEPAGRGIRLSVLDDGPGIPPEARERVLTRFYRLPGTPGPGSGLGLAIVKAAAEAHGGALIIGEGLQGRGTGVQVTLGPRGAGRGSAQA